MRSGFGIIRVIQNNSRYRPSLARGKWEELTQPKENEVTPIVIPLTHKTHLFAFVIFSFANDKKQANVLIIKLRLCWLLDTGVTLGRSCWQLVEAFCWVTMRPRWLVGPPEVCSLYLLLILSDGRRRSVVEGIYIHRLAEVDAPCIPTSFSTYHGPQGLTPVFLVLGPLEELG